MSSDTDLSHAITMHPHPFHLHPHPQRSGTPTSRRLSGEVPPKHGTSTAYEPLTPPAEDHDPTYRMPLPQSPGSTNNDLEAHTPPQYTPENDPYQLSSKIKSDAELLTMRAKTLRNRGTCTPLTKKCKADKLQDFYKSQNENIERLLKPVDEHVRLAKEFHGENQLKFKLAVQGSFIANLVLAALQVYGAVSSGSLSLFTTMADAIFDPLSNVTLIACNHAVKSVDPRKFPSGKARIETAGNIFFCFLMTTVSFILIVLSARQVAEGSTSETTRLHIPAIIAVGVAFITKFALFCYCWALRNKYSQIRILWEDHRNDLFINGFGLLTSIGGSKLKWYIDPIGAIVLSLLISTLWLRTAYSEFQLLIGVTADTATQQLITYISMTYSPMILAIDTVRAYHSGPRLVVEVDVVMNPEETLRATHDVAEELQTKLESLPDVERAYVHVDFETSHKPEHFLKKVL
ncbi:MAG: hypothetical protein M1836_004168 [Candelina mexicana]|nr:MAG: hypothetical protein M1836_004168 [Candelina mexicana]